MPKFIIPLLGVALAAGQAIALPILDTRIPLLDIVIFLLAVLGSVTLVQRYPDSISKVKNLWPLGVFGMVAIISWAVALVGLQLPEALSALLYLLRLLAYLFLPVTLSLITNKTNEIIIARQLLYAFFVFAILGFIQLAFLPDLSIWEHLGWDPHQHRLFSTLLDPNFAGFVLGMGATLALILLLRFRDTVRTSESSIILGVLLLAQMLTFSRTGLLATVIMMSVVLWYYQKKWLVAFGLALVLLVVATPRLQSRVVGAITLDDTAKYRIESWLQAAQIIERRPFLGVGYNTLSSTRYDYALPGSTNLVFRAASGFDSSLLTIAATTGLFGLGAFLYMIVVSLRTAFKQVQGLSPFPLWFISLTVGLLVGAWFVNAWLYPPVLVLWLIALAYTHDDPR